MISAGGETYSANGTKIVERGWLDFYSFASLGERELPDFKKGERVQVSKIDMREMLTQPPKRYSKAALLAELEKRDLGTKATRASIIDTLFKRGYLDGAPIKATEFGMSVYDALHENVSMIVDEATTRQLEKDMEKIVEGKKTEEEVIGEGKRMLLDALKLFDSNKAKITEAMKKGLAESSIGLGKCPKDGGDLVVRRSRMGKQFAACDNYPKCTTTFSLPQGAKIVGTGKACEHCHTPIIKVIRAGKGVFEMDLDPNCKTKAGWRSRQEKKAEAEGRRQLWQIPEKKTKKKAAPKKVKKVKATAAVKAKAEEGQERGDMMFLPPAYRRLKRGPQVMLPKDIGMVIAYTGITKESKCVDAGTGSGWLAVSLARVAKEVTSYETREEFMKLAQKNASERGARQPEDKEGGPHKEDSGEEC